MAEENEVTANKLTEEHQVTTKEVQQVITKNPKKVEAGKRLAEYNCKKRESQKSKQVEPTSQYYGIGAVIAVGAIGGLDYYLYQTKQPSNPEPPGGAVRPLRPQNNKFEMD